MDYSSHSLNVRDNVNEIEKITLNALKENLIKCLDMNMKLLKVEADLGEWTQTAYLKSGEQILVLRGNESFPNKVNELVLTKNDLAWMYNNL